MKTDIKGRAEIELMVNSFYDKIKVNTTIGYLFAGVDWPVHLPTMYDFWENTLFHTGGYTGNPIKVHQSLHQRMPLNPEHFKVWLALFLETVNELFEGANAGLIKQRAMSIATVIEMKTVYDQGGLPIARRG